MDREIGKEKKGIYLEMGLWEQVDQLLEPANARSRNEFVSQAIKFYIGYLTSTKIENYMLTVISSVMHSTVKDTENRIAWILFKLAVEGAEIIVDNCQATIFGGFAPNSESAEVLSRGLGNRTVMSGSISRGKNDPNQSLQMIQRPLMTSDELKALLKGNFVVSKTGTHSTKTRLKLFPKWGITFGEPYEIGEKAAREVAYANRQELEEEIIRRYTAYEEFFEGDYGHMSGTGGISPASADEVQAL